jgi:hypothetical protein
MKQLHVVIDNRTSMVCLDVVGQIKHIDEPFQTLLGEFDTPPFHIHCRTAVAVWLPGFRVDARRQANLEIQRRTAKQRDRDAARRIPRPDEGPRLSARHLLADGRILPLPGDTAVDQAMRAVRKMAADARQTPGPQAASRAELLDRLAAVLLFEPFVSLLLEELNRILEIVAAPRVWLLSHLPRWLRRMVLRAERNARVTRR